MLKKTQDTNIELVVAISHLFKHISSDNDVSLKLSLFPQSVVISNLPYTTDLTFVLNGRTIEIEHNTANGLDRKCFRLNNLPDVEDYIIKVFGL